MTKKRKVGCSIGVIALGVLAICLIAGLFWIGIREYEKMPRLVSEFNFSIYSIKEYTYSQEQAETINTRGYPQSFSILFYHTVDPQGKKAYVRHEAWDYPASGQSLIFENGYLIAENGIDPYPAVSTRYQPASFTAFMIREQIAAAANLDEWLILPVEDELMANADLYFAEGLTFGLQNDELIYIEAVGFEDPNASIKPVPPSSAAPAPSVSGPPATASSNHPIDNSILLMFSSHMRMNGEVDSAYIPSAHLAALSQQASNGNEMDALIQLYSDMIAKLRASDTYNPELEARLMAELESKVAALKEKAQALEARRSRRRGGLFGWLNRGFKALGRGTGWLMGKTMDGAGKVVEFAIEDVAPKVLKDALYGGTPISAALIRKVTRKLLLNRVSEAIVRNKKRQMEGESRGEPTEDPAVWKTNEAEFGLDAGLMSQEEMDATREARKTAQAAPNTEGDGSDDGSVSGSGTVSFTFTDRDVPNFGSSTFGTSMFQWHKKAGPLVIGNSVPYDWCYYSTYFPIETGKVHLVFNKEAMTVSGYFEGKIQKRETLSGMSMNAINVSGSYRVEFSNLTTVPADNGYRFEGSGNANLEIGGNIACRQRDTEEDRDVYTMITDQSSAQFQIPLKGFVPNPETISGDQPIRVSIGGEAGPVNDLSINVLFISDQ